MQKKRLGLQGNQIFNQRFGGGGTCEKNPGYAPEYITAAYLPFSSPIIIRDCAIIMRRGGGAEKLELSSKNLDSTPLQNKKKWVLTPLCYVKNNVAPPTAHPPTHTHTPTPHRHHYHRCL